VVREGARVARAAGCFLRHVVSGASWRDAQYFGVPLVAFPGYAGSCGGEPAPGGEFGAAGL